MMSDTEHGRDPLGQALAVPVEPVARLDPAGFDPSREEMVRASAVDCTLEQTLQMIYNSEVNVTISTMWDGGFDLAIGGALGWTEPRLVGCVYGSHNIGPWFRLAFDHLYDTPNVSGLSHTGVDRG